MNKRRRFPSRDPEPPRAKLGGLGLSTLAKGKQPPIPALGSKRATLGPEPRGLEVPSPAVPLEQIEEDMARLGDLRARLGKLSPHALRVVALRGAGKPARPKGEKKPK